MKTYGELSIDLHSISPEEFGDLAAAAAIGGWARDRSKDEEMKRTGGNGAWFTFTLTGHMTLPSAFLFVTQKGSGTTLYVPNIISPARDRLDYDEYNQILKSFAESVLTPLDAQNVIEFSLSRMDLELAAQLPKDVYDRLRRFSVAANKKTGSSHPLDQERWMDFLVASDEARVLLDSHTLARWLVEVEGWKNEQASRLAEEYEFGRELLQRRRRAS
jgi:hypothetical protein